MTNNLDSERTYLINPSTDLPEKNSFSKYHVYKRRWWILFIFCCNVVAIGLFFNTWGPITQSAEVYFGWSDGIIGLLVNWSSITVITGMVPLSYMLDKRGLRFSIVICSGFALIGTGLRCITKDPTIATWLINGGHILIGIASAVFVAAPPLLTVTWFPPQQRTTATALSMMSLAIGIAGSFVLGPQAVQTPRYENKTFTVNESYSFQSASNISSNHSGNHSVLVNFDQIGKDIMFLMYIECGIAAVLFLSVLLYFPERPPKPPSKTASLERTDFRKALNDITRNRTLWLLVLGYCLPNGIFGNWGPIIDVILIPIGVSQTEVGNLAAVSTIAGCVAAIVIARFSDIFAKHMRITLIVLYLVALASFTWFILLVEKVIEFKLGYLWAAALIGNIAQQSVNPLFFELACETAYPVAEGVTGGLLTFFNNVVGGIFLLVLLIPNIGTAWMNYCLVAGIGAGILVLIIYKESYSRINIDLHVPETDEKNDTTGHGS